MVDFAANRTLSLVIRASGNSFRTMRLLMIRVWSTLTSALAKSVLRAYPTFTASNSAILALSGSQ
jgi:hypothetical protein